MNLFHIVVLSIIEGVTEFLPVSSTGHLILASSLLHIKQTNFVTSFEIFIQLGAILGIVLLYAKTILVQKKKLISLGAAFIPTAIVGFLLYKIVKHILLGNPWVVVVSLFIGGIALILFERLYKVRSHNTMTVEKLSIAQAAGIGVFQSLSIIPGVSRSAATILGGQILGLSKKDAVEFSFLLAVPTMVAATGLDLVKSHAFAFSGNEWFLMGVGFCISCITAILVVKLFLEMIQKKNVFLWFGIYRIVIALLYTSVIIL